MRKVIYENTLFIDSFPSITLREILKKIEKEILPDYLINHMETRISTGLAHAMTLNVCQVQAQRTNYKLPTGFNIIVETEYVDRKDDEFRPHWDIKIELRD